jgi:hypothetical protein
MPLDPYIISGTARKGPFQGIKVVSTTVNSSGGEVINIYVSEGSELAISRTITFNNVSSGETLSSTTDSSGEYSVNLANLTTYTIGDPILVTLDTRDNVNLDNQGISKAVQIDRQNKIHDENYPLPVQIAESLRSHAFVVGNVQTEWTTTRDDARPETETVIFPDGSSYRMTFIYAEIGSRTYIKTRSRWQKL